MFPLLNSNFGVLGLRGDRGDRGLFDLLDLTERTSSSNVVLLDDFFGLSKSKALPRFDFGVVVSPLFGVAGIGEAKNKVN